MKVRRTLTCLFVCVAALLMTGCYESDMPLDPAPQIPADTRILGIWRCATPDRGDAAFTLTITRATEASYFVRRQEAGKDPEPLEGYASALNGALIINMHSVADQQRAAHWNFVRYSLLQINVMYVRVVHERLLKGVAPADVRATVEREVDNPELYEDSFVCIRSDN